jgi:hypothetical protein
VANPGRYVAAESSILLRRSVRNALAPPGAGLLATRDAGRTAAGRAGSFNSGKNLSGIKLAKLNYFKFILI